MRVSVDESEVGGGGRGKVKLELVGGDGGSD